MSKSSGTLDGLTLPAGEIRFARSGAVFSVGSDGVVHFKRGEVEGSRKIAMFVGSGHAAMSVLWESGGGLFQLPVALYAGRRWAPSPGFDESETLSIARPITPECLNCHATGLRHRSGTINLYNSPPITEAGIGCERCHGPGDSHAAHPARDNIVNPRRLTAKARDSVCDACHLTGVERINRPNRSMLAFRPGADLDDFVVTFAAAGTSDRIHTASHSERLRQSACKQASGDKLWCGSCHDAHRTPKPAEVSAFYRTRCLSCHEQTLHADREDCIGCHMPARAATDGGGARFTDHSIPKFARSRQPESRLEEIAVVGGKAPAREEGLFLARTGTKTNDGQRLRRALDLLDQAYRDGQRDAEALAVLGYLSDWSGDTERAVQLYEQAIEHDPAQTEAALNLGSSNASAGRLERAIELWLDVARRNPGLEPVHVKLATAFLIRGDKKQALDAVMTCLRYHPDSARARELLSVLRPEGK